MGKHRCQELIDNALNKGADCIILQGTGIDDLFLYDFYYGVRTSLDNYLLMFLHKFGFSRVVHVSEREVPKVYYAADNEKGFREDTDGFFSETDDDEEEDVLSAIPDSDVPRSSNSKALQQQAEENSDALRINMLAEKIRQNDERTLVYFERFDYYAKLYTQDAERQTSSLRLVHELQKLRNCTVMLSMTNAEKLSPFDIRTTGSNVIYIGNPSAYEIKFTYLRMFLRYMKDKGNCRPELIKQLGEVAEAIASSDKLLRQAVAIFDKIVIRENLTEIDKQAFEIAIESIVPEKVTLDDVIMRRETKDSILNAVKAFINAEDNTSGRKGMILTGPPGTGKTHIIKAIANEFNCYFLAPTLADLKGEYVGQSSGKVSRIFSQARANSPTILFLDEADTIFPYRGGAEEGDSFTNDMVNQFLVEIDGLVSAKHKIFVIAATNRPDVIDRAIRSRLTSIVEVGLPDMAQRRQLLAKRLLKYGIQFENKPFADRIAERTEKMSGRDIDNFVKKLSENAAKSGLRLGHIHDDALEQLLARTLDNEMEELIFDLRRDGVDVIPPSENPMSYSDIIGYEEEKEKIDQQARYITADETEKSRYRTFHIVPKKGILLYGPPGNGKTELIRAAAGENRFYLIRILSKDFASAIPEQQLQKLESIFAKTQRLSCIMANTGSGILLFFDEFDSLAGRSVLNQVVRGTLLDHMTDDRGGMRAEHSKILFAAATNFYEQLDEALIRKGRIDEHICLNDPSPEVGLQFLEKRFTDPDLDAESFTKEDIRRCYERLAAEKQQRFLEAELSRIRALPFEQQLLSDPQFMKSLEEKAAQQNPSIVEISNYFEDIKLRSFLEMQKNGTSAQKKIRVVFDRSGSEEELS